MIYYTICSNYINNFLSSHNEAVQSMQFNPISNQLLSCSLSDFALWSTEQKAVQKYKLGGRVNCCAWTKDGKYMALGLALGYVSIRNKVSLIVN
jgi:intraflagellar transport protein 122